MGWGAFFVTFANKSRFKTYTGPNQQLKMKLPEGFINNISELSALSGGDALQGLATALTETEPAIGIRRNRRKTTGWANPSLTVVEWAPEVGATLTGERPRFTLDPALHQGRYYVQDPSSMLTAVVVEHITEKLGRNDLIYVDVCAAPGGKTTAAIDALGDEALVIANEHDHKRVGALIENLAKWGTPNVVVTENDGRKIGVVGEIADVVAADVPCSGEGMMRKDSDAVEQWSQRLVAECAELQREIVASAWKLLKPGGYFIYSTCTFNRQENEENVEWMINELGAKSIELPALPGKIAGAIGSDIHAARFIPGRVDGEGLFMVLLRKPGEWTPTPEDSKTARPVKELKAVELWLREGAGYSLELTPDSRVYALPSRYGRLIGRIRSKLNVKAAGVNIASQKGKAFQPTQQYALSPLCRTESDGKPFAGKAEVDYPRAIAYLRGEAITIDAPRGMVVLTFNDMPLGVVNNLGNRANNRYPDGWAIKTTHVPDSFAPLVK